MVKYHKICKECNKEFDGKKNSIYCFECAKKRKYESSIKSRKKREDQVTSDGFLITDVGRLEHKYTKGKSNEHKALVRMCESYTEDELEFLLIRYNKKKQELYQLRKNGEITQKDYMNESHKLDNFLKIIRDFKNRKTQERFDMYTDWYREEHY